MALLIATTEQTVPKLSVIVPFLDEEENLPELIHRIRETPQWPSEYEIVFVSDGSTDGSVAYIERESTNDPRIKLIVLTRNFGHQSAVSAGLHFVRGQYVALMDADLQDEPHVVAEMLNKAISADADVVYGVREKRVGSDFMRCLYWMFYKLYGFLSDTPAQLDSGDFCVMSRKTINLLNELPERIRFHRGLRSRVGLKQIAHPVVRPDRFAGQPQYNFRALTMLALNGLTAVSLKPLRISTAIGMFLCCIAMFGAFLYFLSGLISDVPRRVSPGFTTIVVLQLFLGGLLFMNLGIMGEYLGCIYLEVKKRPGFLVDRTVNLETERALSNSQQ
jgi:glycosyltransferase involved in cell wall biosynthesis